MKAVKNQHKIWDKKNQTYISASHNKSTWATLTGAKAKIFELCSGYSRYSPKRKPEEFELRIFEMVCVEVKSYELVGKSLKEIVASIELAPIAPIEPTVLLLEEPAIKFPEGTHFCSLFGAKTL